MKRALVNILLVTAGAAIGSVVTWKVLKDKYELIVQEEIDSVKEEYQILRDQLYSAEAVAINNKVRNELQNEVSDESEDDDDDILEPTEDEVFEYHKIVSGYRSSEDTDDETDKEGGMGDPDETPYVTGPYVISPDDFRCSPPGYNAQALDYFSNNVLADGWGKIMNIEETIGHDSLDHFGEYADDVLYVRNDMLEIDYEITQDPRTYDEVYYSHYNA